MVSTLEHRELVAAGPTWKALRWTQIAPRMPPHFSDYKIVPRSLLQGWQNFLMLRRNHPCYNWFGLLSGPQCQKLSDQQNTPDPSRSIHKKNGLTPNLILIRGIAFEKISTKKTGISPRLFPLAFLSIGPIGSRVFCWLDNFRLWGSPLYCSGQRLSE